MLTPTQRIFAGAVIGAATGVASIIVLLLFEHPESNMGGVAAILIGAPLGAIAGAMFADRENKAIVILWVLTLLATLVCTIGPRLMAPPIVVQLLFVFAAFRFRTGHNWPLAAIFILTAALSLFPPVAGGVTSIFDSRLDASRHVPELTVERWLLATEFAIALLIAIPIIRSARKNKSAAESAAPQRVP
ncbi:MAG TPA: hypothetical protein VF381_06530 [Thermoanaerobaculia bacterium]